EEARRLHLEEALTTGAIETRVGVPLAVVRQQVLDALLLPPAGATTAPRPEAPTADPSQARATAHRGAPFLLQAGPGTGKTHALVQRVTELLEERVDPASIAIMTFSNRAAGELHERLARTRPAEAPNIWVGT